MMIRMKKTSYTILLSFFLAFIIFNFSEDTAKATGSVTQPSDYHFVFDGQTKEANSTAIMGTKESLVYVTSGSWETGTTVKWVNSRDNVVKMDFSDTSLPSNYVKLVRQGPGYSTVSAIITNTSTGASYTISFVVEVDLYIDSYETGTQQISLNSEEVLVFDTVGQEKTIYLKYINYTPSSGSSAVTGSAISANLVSLTSDNQSVATVVSGGAIKAIGAGSATITITSNTLSTKDKPMTVKLKVVVAPKFSLSFSNTNGNQTYNSIVRDTDTGGLATEVPSNFVLVSNARAGTNLTWEVIDAETKKVITATSKKLSYSVSEISGNVTFSNVKAGTYLVYAYADKGFNKNTNVPYAYMKIVVPLDVGKTTVYMTVGDTYNVLNNSNLPYIGVFSGVSYNPDDMTIAKFDTTDYVITAKRKGKVEITLTYDTGLKLFDSGTDVKDKTITVYVIDGIALSMTNATMYTKGTLPLDVKKTDNSSEVIWTSSNPDLATVTGGIVTAGTKTGTVIITASQEVDGVVKKATCEILIQQSVSTITLVPDKIILPVNGAKSLYATITPSGLSGVKLMWKSSDEAIVKITDPGATTATALGVSGGTAVITAINQDNVVVGYCHVTVQQSALSIELSESAVTVDMNVKRFQLRATVYPENATNKNVLWKSADTSKATVDTKGLVTILKPGTVSIIATSEDNPSVSAICNINVTVPVVTIALDETTKTMYVGQSARLSYTVLPANANNNAVTWTSTNTNAVTVDGTGKVTAKNTGTSVIIARTADGGYSVYCTITVKRTATAIKLDVSDLKLKTGEYYIIKPTLTPKDSTEIRIVWESSDTKVATVDADGKVIAKSTGNAIIMAKIDSGAVAYCKVAVTQPVKGLILNFTEKTIFVKTKFTLEASLNPSTASKLGVTWKSSNEKVATISKNGEVTGLIGGVAIITCSTEDGGFTSTCVVTVKEPVTTIKLNYDTYRIGIGQAAKLTVTVTSESATNQEVRWTSSNEKVATVNQKGKITGISLGYATITVTAKDGSEVDDSCQVRVVVPVESITINDNYMTLYTGDSKKLKATIRPKDSTYHKAKWTSSDTSIALVDDDGVVTAIKAGSATITAETMDNGGKKAVCVVAVNDRVPATGITLQDKSLTMISGEEKIVQLVLNPVNSTDSFTWSTDNPAVAKVDRKSGRITAKAPGIAYITVMTDSGKTATVEVTVIGLNTSELVTEEYTTYTNALEVLGSTGAVTYRVDNPLIAVVYNNGTVSTRGVGATTITVSVNGRKLKCRLIVNKMK